MLDLEDEVFHAAIDRGVLCSKGSWFRAEADGGVDMYFRMTFAAAPMDKLTEGVKRFGDALRASFELAEE